MAKFKDMVATRRLQPREGVLSLWDAPSLTGRGDQNAREKGVWDRTWEGEATAQGKCRSTKKEDQQL